jgi:succinate dehydrogenase / fumarate reductase membrane anchor subunit
MSVHPDLPAAPPARSGPALRPLARLLWLAQALSGLALVALLGLHWVAQHYLAAGGLRTYAEVVAWVRQPWALGLEALSLAVVTAHALLGLRAVLLDYAPGPRARRWLDLALVGLGSATLMYGLDLLRVIARG